MPQMKTWYNDATTAFKMRERDEAAEPEPAEPEPAAACETCEGTGRVTITGRHRVDTGTRWARTVAEDRFSIDCPHCNGTGTEPATNERR